MRRRLCCLTLGLLLLVAAGLGCGGPRTSDERFVLSDCDEDWAIGKTQSEDYKEGTGAVAPTAKSVVILQHSGFEMGETRLAYQNAGLHLWLYLSDVSLVTEGQIEVTSSGECDREENHWLLKTLIASRIVVSGWNELWLSWTDTALGGDADLDGVNYFRVYFGTRGEEATLRVDDVYLFDKTV